MKKALHIFMLCLLPAVLLAQVKTLDRRYVPVIGKTSAAPLFELNVKEWAAFRYDSAQKLWVRIPFQFDQLTDKGRYDREPDDITDATDEIIFMPADAGDRAPVTAWLNDAATKSSPRLELEFADPLDPEKKAWIYLFKNVSTDDIPPSYLSYVAGPTGMRAADTIKTSAFALGHNQNGWMDYLSLGQNKIDLFDRFKMRLAGKMLIGPSYEINEDFVEAETGDDIVEFIPGPVRAFHFVKAKILISKLGLPLLPDEAGFVYNFEYTPFGFEIDAETELDNSLLVLFGIKLVRQSLDLNANAGGMRFFSHNNPAGIPIDGVQDTFVDSIQDNETWVMASGDNGTIVINYDMSSLLKSKRGMYYHDNMASGSTGDNTVDTGDAKSYGDMGVVIRATGDAIAIDPSVGRLAVRYKGYFIDQPNTNIDFGRQILAWEQNPLTLTATSQSYDPTRVTKQPALAPRDFSLHNAYPNPYHVDSEGGIRFEFSGPIQSSYELIIYNVIGQQVARFTNLAVNNDGRRTLLWDVRDNRGQRVTPGVYFYQLRSGTEKLTQKLIIAR